MDRGICPHGNAYAFGCDKCEIESLRSTITRLREYAKHRYTCHIGHYNPRTGGDHPCDCGYDDLIKEIGG